MVEKKAIEQGTSDKGRTRIQREKRQAILEAGLTVFSQEGFRGATLDRIASEAGLSKPNLLYYFPSKDAIHDALLNRLLETWLDPLVAMNPDGDPLEEIQGYVRSKLEMAREYPRESRLWANEIIRGAPHIRPVLEKDLRTLVEDRSGVIQGWIDAGRIAPVDPVHLFFSIWSLTQHYADFEVQIQAVLGDGSDPYEAAQAHLDQLFERMLTV